MRWRWRHSLVRAAVVVSTIGVVLTLACRSAGPRGPDSATVPLDPNTDAAIVELDVVKADGGLRTARFVVDTGGGGFLISESLAGDIAARRTGPAETSGEGRFVPIAAPEVRLGPMPLDLSGVPAAISLGAKRISARDDAEGLVPARLLRKYHVIFDYPARELTLARPGTRTPVGERVAAPIGRTGFPRVELAIAGRTYGFLLDTGATFTMISRQVLDEWAGAHADWPRTTGAVGAANMFGGSMEADAPMVRAPAAGWGSLRADGFAAVARPAGTFETYMSEMMSAPIVGAVGGNVLRMFRVEIDYANGAVYLQKTGSERAHDLDLVGLTLIAEADGHVTISGVSPRNGKAVLDAVHPGDRLLRVDGLEAAGASLSAIQKALSGAPGATKVLQLERDGKPITVTAVVASILGS